MVENQKSDEYFMKQAYEEALHGLKQNGIPIGAVLVIDDKVVAKGHNKRIQELSMIKHGEMDCLENTKREIAASLMQRATLYTTLSPCFMCVGAILLNKIPRVVIGENKTFQQSEAWLRQHKVELLVLNDRQCIEMMVNFITEHPALWAEDIGLTAEQVLAKYDKLLKTISI